MPPLFLAASVAQVLGRPHRWPCKFSPLAVMSRQSLFVPLAEAGVPQRPALAVTFNGQPLQVPAGTSVAAALLAAGVHRFRTSPPSGAGRAPYCMMGVCFECLLDIDGVPNRQSCLVPIAPGMVIRTQDSLPEPGIESGDPARALASAMEASHGQ